MFKELCRIPHTSSPFERLFQCFSWWVNHSKKRLSNTLYFGCLILFKLFTMWDLMESCTPINMMHHEKMERKKNLILFVDIFFQTQFKVNLGYLLWTARSKHGSEIKNCSGDITPQVTSISRDICKKNICITCKSRKKNYNWTLNKEQCIYESITITYIYIL